MFPARSLVSRVSPLLKSNLAFNQRRTLISGPPAVRISLAEKFVHMSLIGIGMFVVPLYVLMNVRKYRERS